MKILNSINRPCRRLLITFGLVSLPLVNVHADYQGTVLGDQPVAYYPINSSVDPTGITATDLSGNGNNGTYNGTDPEYNTVPGPSTYIPNALYFDGFTSYVDLSTGGNPGLLNFSGPITLEAWVQPANTTEGPANIIAKGYESSVNSEITLRANGGNYFGGSYDGNSHGATGGQQTTNWAYVVCSYDGTNWSLYVNSILVQRNPDSVGAINFSSPWRIGTGSGDYGSSRYFSGNLTEVAMYTNGLTAGQVLKHYYAGLLNSDPAVSVPIIVSQPQSQSTYSGGTVSFSVTAVSALPMTNQWYKGGVPMPGETNTTLTLSSVGAGDDVNYRVVVGNSNGITNSVDATLSLFTPANLKWSNNGNSGVWDTSSSANWVDLSSSSQTVFNPGDQVLFDDAINVPTNVTVNDSVAPSLITVDSSTNNFNLSSGTITGTGAFIKKGSSPLTITSAGNFTGPVTLSGGSVYAGNNCFASVSSIRITNNATLDMGGGTFNNNKPVTVSGAGVNGQGAIFNSYADYPQESLNVTLAGDAVFGASARWDLASGSHISGPHKLTIDWSAGSGYGEWNSPVIGADVAGITLTNGNLGAKGMDNSFQNPATILTVSTNCQLVFYSGGWNGSLHILGGGQAALLTAPSAFNGSSIVLETGAQWQSYYNTNDEPINSAITLNGIAHFVLGDHNMIYTNVISGPGGFVLDYWNHAVVFSSANTYGGPTIIGSSGNSPAVVLTGNGSISQSSLIFFGGNDPAVERLDASGRSDQTLTLAAGQTLAGIGALNGSLVVSPGATLSPSGTNVTLGITAGANATGTIIVSNSVSLNGTTMIKLNGSGVNDAVQAGGSINYGGTLNLVNVSGSPLAAGNSFQVFSAGGNLHGSFAGITPATPGAGLAWDTSQLNTGFISVVASSQPVIGSVNVSGGNLIFSGTGGTANGSYAVLTTTNLATPNWTPVMTNNFNGTGGFSVTNAISAGTPQEFYRIQQLP